MWKKMIANDQEEMNFLVQTVARVHGENHPEMEEVKSLYEELQTSDHPEKTFTQLRKVTKNYQIPEDACQAFEKVYHTLEAYDHAFVEGSK